MDILITVDSGMGAQLGPNFNLTSNVGTVTPSTATRTELIAGKLVSVNDSSTVVYVTSTGVCTSVLTIDIGGITTTTTSTEAPTTTTTSTSTTTTLAPIPVTLAYSNIDGPTACYKFTDPSPITSTYYLQPGASLADGNTLYVDGVFSNIVADGFYSNGVNYWEVNVVASGGVLSNGTPCPQTTTTTTSTSTTSTTSTSTTSTSTTSTSTTSTTTLAPAWYSLYSCVDGTTQNSTQKTVGTFTVNERVTFGGAFWYVLAELTSNPGGALIDVVTVGGSGTTGCPATTTTTSTTTIPALNVTNGSITCSGGTSAWRSSFAGGSGNYSYAAYATSQANVANVINNGSDATGVRVTLGSGDTYYDWSGIADGTWYTAVKDSAGTVSVQNTAITANCTTPTTTTTAAPTTTTTTAAPTQYTYIVKDMISNDLCTYQSTGTDYWSYTSYTSGFYTINGGGVRKYLEVASHTNYTNQITSVGSAPCTPVTTTTTSTTSTTTSAPTSSDVFISVQGSLDVEITDVQVDGVSVTLNSPYSYPISVGTNPNVNGTVPRVGTYGVVVYYGCSIGGQRIEITDSTSTMTCQGTGVGSGQTLGALGQVLNGSTAPYLTIEALDGTC